MKFEKQTAVNSITGSKMTSNPPNGPNMIMCFVFSLGLTLLSFSSDPDFIRLIDYPVLLLSHPVLEMGYCVTD